ncbi:MAG TPA: hypothetical protein VIM98_12995 [Dyella sp.]|uniref:hypothetical protein n=1 Tax=Dyella sp. TaxID=1869338 RepID=UPI002F950960
MSDFLDRLATRAIGGGSILSPRLPSFFEPVANASGTAIVEAPTQMASAPKTRVGDDEPLHPHRPVEKRVSADTSTRPPPVSAVQAEAVLARSERVEIANPEVSAAIGNKREARGALEAPPLPSVGTQVSRDADMTVRERHIVHEQEIVRSVREEQLGTLLPPRAPIFATTEDASPPAASGQRPAATRTAERPQAPGEPVVHVSIGRLEVRAIASASTAAPRRQESPRSGSMDDYLRQRDGQGS